MGITEFTVIPKKVVYQQENNSFIQTSELTYTSGTCLAFCATKEDKTFWESTSQHQIRKGSTVLIEFLNAKTEKDFEIFLSENGLLQAKMLYSGTSIEKTILSESFSSIKQHQTALKEFYNKISTVKTLDHKKAELLTAINRLGKTADKIKKPADEIIELAYKIEESQTSTKDTLSLACKVIELVKEIDTLEFDFICFTADLNKQISRIKTTACVDYHTKFILSERRICENLLDFLYYTIFCTLTKSIFQLAICANCGEYFSMSNNKKILDLCESCVKKRQQDRNKNKYRGSKKNKYFENMNNKFRNLFKNVDIPPEAKEFIYTFNCEFKKKRFSKSDDSFNKWKIEKNIAWKHLIKSTKKYRGVIK